ncbi:MAG: hypothetical protein IM574_08340 [Cytophagales bacterium]|jgi:hypothetical protein|nr:hypothetical protein [Cytophagales bacterium]NOS56866.1 hypothetical protein [Cyclobacteriaceae bacterium]MCA6387657.1 hypothetical protein [Cytophagales bacterium]MCA6392120.1 hypothetical protein [Cytophagales bacterium]MCA6393819.1 hypothetical protein [Cytophagales bacterium]
MATFYKTYVAQVKKKSPGFYRDFSEFLLFYVFNKAILYLVPAGLDKNKS